MTPSKTIKSGFARGYFTQMKNLYSKKYSLPKDHIGPVRRAGSWVATQIDKYRHPGKYITIAPPNVDKMRKEHYENEKFFAEIHKATNKSGSYITQPFSGDAPASTANFLRIRKIPRKNNRSYRKTRTMARSYRRKSRGRYRKKSVRRSSSAYKQQRPEKKYRDISVRLLPNSDPSETQGIQGLNYNIQQGSSYFNRIGNRTQMLYMKINGYTVMHPTSDDDGGRPAYMRVFLVHDKQPDGNNIIVSDVLQSASPAPSSTIPSLQHTNVLNQQRFTIIMSKKIVLRQVGQRPLDINTNADQISNWSSAAWSWYVPIPSRLSMSNYSASTGTIGDIASGAFHIFSVTSLEDGNDSVTGEVLSPQLELQIRMCYYG